MAMKVSEIAKELEIAAWAHIRHGGCVSNPSVFVNEIFQARPQYGAAVDVPCRTWSRYCNAATKGARDARATL